MPTSGAKKTGSGSRRLVPVDVHADTRIGRPRGAGRAGIRNDDVGLGDVRRLAPDEVCLARGDGGGLRPQDVVRIVVRQRYRRGQGAGVGGVLRLVPGGPHHAVVDDEHAESDQPDQGHRHVDEHGSALAAATAVRQRATMWRRFMSGLALQLLLLRRDYPAAEPAGASATPGVFFSTSSLMNALRRGRQRRHLVGLERPHKLRRDEHHQLGLLLALGLALEQVPDDRNATQDGHLRRRPPARCCAAARRWRTTGRRAVRRLSPPGG